MDLDAKDYKDYLSESRKAALILQDQSRLEIVVAGEKGFAVSGGAGMLRAMLSAQKELYANGRIDAYDLTLTYCLLGGQAARAGFAANCGRKARGAGHICPR